MLFVLEIDILDYYVYVTTRQCNSISNGAVDFDLCLAVLLILPYDRLDLLHQLLLGLLSMLEQSLCFIIKTQDLGSQHVDLRRSGVAVDEGAVGGGDHHRSPHRDIILVGILHESRCDSSWLLTHVPSSLHVPRSDLLHVR